MPTTTINKRQNTMVRSANRFTIVFGDIPIGLLQNCRCSDDYAPEPLSGIGDIHRKEWVPTIANHNITATQAVLFTGNLRQLGVAYENGDDALKAMVFDIEVYDRIVASSVNPGSSSPVTMLPEGQKGTLLRRYEKCSFASGDTEITKHAIIMSNVTINACNAVTPQGSPTSLI